MAEIDRDTLRELLTRWLKGDLDERDVHEEAERLWSQSEEWPEYSEEDPRSIPLEVLSQLEILNHQLITKEDVPAMLRFLDTPPSRELDAWRRWREYWDEVDFDKRRQELKDNPYYIAG